MTINFSVIVVVHILGTPIQIQKEVAIGIKDLDGERELVQCRRNADRCQ